MKKSNFLKPQIEASTPKSKKASRNAIRKMQSRNLDNGKWFIDKTAIKPTEFSRPNYLDGKRLFHSHPKRRRDTTSDTPLPRKVESIKRKRSRPALDSGFASPLAIDSLSLSQDDTSWILDNVFSTPSPIDYGANRKRPRKLSLLMPPDLNSSFKVLTPRTKNYPDEFCHSFLDGEKRQLLGKGSFGCVYMGEIRGVKVAAKLCPNYDCTCCGERNGLDLNHANIVVTHRILPLDVISTRALLDRPEISDLLNIRKDHLVSRGMMIVMMEYAGEQSLQRLLDYSSKSLEQERLDSLLAQIASALSHIHSRQILHLDLKPKNIMVTSHFTCKLVDFGCSKRLNQFDHHKENRSEVIGTVAYAAPELFGRHKPTDKCDVYSFGILMWQLLTREYPYQNDSAHSIIFRVVSQGLRPTFPDLLLRERPKAVQLVRECWDHSPEARPSSDKLTNFLRNRLFF